MVYKVCKARVYKGCIVATKELMYIFGDIDDPTRTDPTVTPPAHAPVTLSGWRSVHHWVTGEVVFLVVLQHAESIFEGISALGDS